MTYGEDIYINLLGKIPLAQRAHIENSACKQNLWREGVTNFLSLPTRHSCFRPPDKPIKVSVYEPEPCNPYFTQRNKLVMIPNQGSNMCWIFHK